jgi:hypothetical protein
MTPASPRADLDLGSVLVLDGYPAGVGNADVASLATLGSGDGLDAFRPPPPRLEREPRGGRRADAHHIHLRLVRRPRLIRRTKVACSHIGHGSLLSSIDSEILALSGAALQTKRSNVVAAAQRRFEVGRDVGRWN